MSEEKTTALQIRIAELESILAARPIDVCPCNNVRLMREFLQSRCSGRKDGSSLWDVFVEFNGKDYYQIDAAMGDTDGA